ncbi:hypothetical protein FRC16_004580, partial [Serendipita sp. 398]
LEARVQRVNVLVYHASPNQLTNCTSEMIEATTQANELFQDSIERRENSVVIAASLGTQKDQLGGRTRESQIVGKSQPWGCSVEIGRWINGCSPQRNKAKRWHP